MIKWQFKELVTAPILAAWDVSPSRLIIVIDTLDECNDRELMVDFIKAIIDTFTENNQFHLWIILMSRVEEHICWQLESVWVGLVITHLSLEQFDASWDIRRFLWKSLSDVYENNHHLMPDVSPLWLSPSQLKALTAKADGLFIFATTLMNFFHDGSDPPQEALYKILTVDVGLDALYMQVLSHAQPTLSNAQAACCFMRVIAW